MRETHGFPEAPFHPIAIHRSAESATDGEPNAQAGARVRAQCLWPWHVKDGHARGKMAASLLVHAFEISMAQQAQAAGKPGLRPSVLLRHFGHTGGHGASNFFFTCSSRERGRVWEQPPPAVRATWTTRGNLVSPRPACAPWRGGEITLFGRPGSSCASGIHASWIACADWVGTYASA